MNNLFRDVVRELSNETTHHVYHNYSGERVESRGHHKRTYSLGECFKKCIDFNKDGDILYKINARKSL